MRAEQSAGLAGDVTRHAIAATADLIGPHVRRTPVISIGRAELGLPAGELVLKLEQLQHSGSFKARGAFSNLLRRDVPAAGVVAASGGNHGAAVAYAAGVLGVPARIFVPEVSSAAKVSRIRSYGADLVGSGASYSDALAISQDVAARSGAIQVHAYDQAETMLGAGTVAIELGQQAPVATVLVASAAAGCWAASARPTRAGPGGRCRAEDAPTLTRGCGRPVDAPVGSVAVDSLAPRRVGELTFR